MNALMRINGNELEGSGALYRFVLSSLFWDEIKFFNPQRLHICMLKVFALAGESQTAYKSVVGDTSREGKPFRRG